MNAYELAEQAEGLAYEIPADWSSGEPKNIATDIANMLRQQADRIKDLEKLLEHSVGADCREMRYIQEIENKDARIAELEKQQKTEPDFYSEQGYPLYITPQIKELSGDEIHEVAKKFLTSYDLEIDQGLYGDTSRVLIAIEDWYGFARAILKKASEK